MHTDAHASEHHQEESHGVQDTIVTRLIGIAFALSVAYAMHALVPIMGWNPIVGGILTGLSGALMGALGTSANGPILGAILGWAGGTNFILGVGLFIFH
ncbi:MAG: hypothetical protein HQ472_07990 [Ignavibacteria bacterium]|nr:hypothetical protein [Ignavibacteria bacterium]